MPRELRDMLKQERLLWNTLKNTRDFIQGYEERRDKGALGLRMKLLDDTYEKYCSVRMQIDSLEEENDNVATERKMDEKELEEQRRNNAAARQTENDEKFKEFQDEYINLKKILGTFETTPPRINQGNTSSLSTSRVKLPELKLPSFSGKFQEWVSFRDTFTSLIHANDTLSCIDKFNYLRTSLSGDALQEVNAIDVTAANYEIAWNALERRFNNKKLIVKTHLDALDAIEPIRTEGYEALSRLINEFEKHMQMLEKAGENTRGWSTPMGHKLCSKLDKHTLREWESHFSSKEVPKYEEVIAFLKDHCLVLQSVASVQGRNQEVNSIRRTGLNHTVSLANTCPFCQELLHSPFKCHSFQQMTVAERMEATRNKDLCLNCLNPDHIAKFCTRSSCRYCGLRHHSMLHYGSMNQRGLSAESPQSNPYAQAIEPRLQSFQSNNRNNQNSPTYARSFIRNSSQPSVRTPDIRPQSANFSFQSDTPSASHTSTNLSAKSDTTYTILLSTALVKISDHFGGTILARALLDSGSQLCFMTESLSQRLKFRRFRETLPIKGIGAESVVHSTQAVLATMSSRITNFSAELKFHVLPKITADMPRKNIDCSNWKLLDKVILADPAFNEPSPIDIIVGAEIFFDLLRHDQMKLSPNGPTLQNTELGWIASGQVPEEPTIYTTLAAHSFSTEQVHHLLTKFWELESCHRTNKFSIEETICEEIFEKTTTRNINGRFSVTLPKRNCVLQQLGNSKETAIKRFLALEKRLDANHDLKSLYVEVIREYKRMNHMREVFENESDPSISYFLPHHAVMKLDSTTTKLRVVFDASCKSSSGISLNDALMVGPTVQEDLFSIMLRFRLHRYAFTADIEKMYRMIDVDPQDRPLQRIIWREANYQPLKIFELSTVTFGTSSAPYLATKCLQKLAHDSDIMYPAASKCLKTDFFVDDLLSGSEEIAIGQSLCADMCQLLSSAGFNLRKWNSNCPKILELIPNELHDDGKIVDLNSSTHTVKTLGLIWETHTDNFKFKIPSWHQSKLITKRTVLSDAARLFDPLGLIGPVVVQAKIFLQTLWMIKVAWDEPLSEELQANWLEFRSSLSGLNNVPVPRWIAYSNDVISIDLHGFGDASERAYGACLYLRCTTYEGNVSVRLLTAKSRVTPIHDDTRKRKKQTVPRLELSAALLLSHLYQTVMESLKISANAYFWTDSTIVKCWLSSHPSRWDSFVGHRVSEIQHITRTGKWHHISGVENPADLISRGLSPYQLMDNRLWWNGPEWLSGESHSWPQKDTTNLDELDLTLLEEHKVSCTVQVIDTNEIFTLKSMFTSLVKLVAWIRRFSYNCKISNRSSRRREDFLTYAEQNEAILMLVRLAQTETFPSELDALSVGKEVKPTSRLKSLAPRIINGVICIGGRLEKAQISQKRKHPMILDCHHPFSKLIAVFYHLKLLHAGQQLTVSGIRERFWILSVRRLVRTVIHECVTCFRCKPKAHEQLMADLPSERVIPAPPFLKIGIDYCGPFNIQYPNRRTTPVKCWVAIFICLATKAVHVEMVTNLTAEAFIAALKRFTARRGRPITIMCDNGTCFVGAQKELQELYNLFKNQQFQRTTLRQANNDGIDFKFIPANSPNFGGLWEAAVKSLKGHMRKVIGLQILFPDEFNTIIIQIEACLNSRPLTWMF